MPSLEIFEETLNYITHKELLTTKKIGSSLILKAKKLNNTRKDFLVETKENNFKYSSQKSKQYIIFLDPSFSTCNCAFYIVTTICKHIAMAALLNKKKLSQEFLLKEFRIYKC